MLKMNKFFFIEKSNRWRILAKRSYIWFGLL